MKPIITYVIPAKAGIQRVYWKHYRYFLIVSARLLVIPLAAVISSTEASRIALTVPNCFSSARFLPGPIPGTLSRDEVKACLRRTRWW